VTLANSWTMGMPGVKSWWRSEDREHKVLTKKRELERDYEAQG